MEKIKYYKAYYIVALFIIAVFTVISHYLISHLIHTNKGFSELINISGRQRMLSQRIASFSAQFYIERKNILKKEIKTSLYLLNKSNQLLSHPFIAEKHNKTEYQKIMHDLYFKKEDSVQYYIDRLNESTSKFLSAKNVAKQADYLKEITNIVNIKMLNKLNDIVYQYQIESETRIMELDRIQLFLLITVILVLLYEALYIFRPIFNSLIGYIKKFQHLSQIDELSGLNNRRMFKQEFEKHLNLVRRYHQSCGLVIIDIDNFKKTNDDFGHKVGDEVIRRFSAFLLNHIRNIDRCFRIGGEEFAVLFPLLDEAKTLKIVERLRQLLEQSQIEINGKEPLKYTVSMGVSIINDDNLEFVFEQADKALYKAKELGRNQVYSFVSKG